MGCASHPRRHPVTQPGGPERNASNAILEEGIESFDQGVFDRATDSFEEAIRIDPSNGAAFYYLAWARFRTGDNEGIWDLIEKAEALLGQDPAWLERIESLKREIPDKP